MEIRGLIGQILREGERGVGMDMDVVPVGTWVRRGTGIRWRMVQDGG
jgi:hypothetical protein